MGANRIFRMGLSSLAILLLAPMAWADFSGNVRVHTAMPNGDELQQTGKIFIEGSANTENRSTRMEMGAPGDPSKVVVLTLPEENSIVTLMPDTKTYIRTPIEGGVGGSPSDELEPSDFKEIGQEQLSGRTTIVKEAPVEEGGEKIATVRIWVAPELNGETVKSQVRAPDGTVSSTVIESPSMRELPESLFEIPRGYREAKAPVPVPGERPGQG